MRSLLAAVSFLAFALPARAQVKNPDVFVEAKAGEVTSLDPAYPYDDASQALILNVYEPLIGFDGEKLDKFVPLLAAEVPSFDNGLISKDGLTYRFPIRRGVRFHDGSLMTPEDVRYSLLRFMLMDRSGGPSALLLQPILGLDSTRDAAGKIVVDFRAAAQAVRVDGDAVVITLQHPFAPFLAVMARWSYVMPEKWAAAHGEWDGTAATWRRYNDPQGETPYCFEHMDGTGPFILERWDRTAKYVLLERNDGYWRKPAALKRVLVKTVPEFATRRQMLQAGEADAVEAPRPLMDQLRGLPGVKIVDDLPRLATDPALFFTFKIDTFANPDLGSGRLDGDGIPPDFFSDPDVRKGFAYAFDYDALIREAFAGKAARAKTAVPPYIPGAASDPAFYSYDPKKAEQHLRKAWNTHLWEKGFRFTLFYNEGSPAREAACRILQRELQRLNPKFQVDVKALDWTTFLDKAQRHQLPMFARGWTADYPDAYDFVYNFYSSDGRFASAQGFHDVEMDQLIDKAVRQVDPRRRQALYDRIQRLGYDDAPSITTAHEVGAYAVRDWVRGFYENPVSLGLYYYPFSKAAEQISSR